MRRRRHYYRPGRLSCIGLAAGRAYKLDGSCLAEIADLRIVVSGSPGSGKTTLVKALAERFELPTTALVAPASVNFGRYRFEGLWSDTEMAVDADTAP